MRRGESRTLGMLAALPEKELIARLGQDGQAASATGARRAAASLSAARTDFALAERMELDAPVELLDSLLFVVSAMLDQTDPARTRRGSSRWPPSPSLSRSRAAERIPAPFGPRCPTNDKQLWIKLLHLDLEAHPPHAAIVGIALTAEPGSTGKVQLGLFSPQLPEPSRLDVTLARIRALVGDGNVWPRRA